MHLFNIIYIYIYIYIADLINKQTNKLKTGLNGLINFLYFSMFLINILYLFISFCHQFIFIFQQVAIKMNSLAFIKYHKN